MCRPDFESILLQCGTIVLRVMLCSLEPRLATSTTIQRHLSHLTVHRHTPALTLRVTSAATCDAGRSARVALARSCVCRSLAVCCRDVRTQTDQTRSETSSDASEIPLNPPTMTKLLHQAASIRTAAAAGATKTSSEIVAVASDTT